MASETITQADKDCALAILEADIAAGGQTPFVKTAAHYIAAHRRAAVAELVEALREVQTQTLGRPVGGGDGATYTVHPISGDLYNRIQSLLSRHQAGLGKGEG